MVKRLRKLQKGCLDLLVRGAPAATILPTESVYTETLQKKTI